SPMLPVEVPMTIPNEYCEHLASCPQCQSFIILDRAHGRAKTMDFGLVRLTYLPGTTQVGMLMGTPEYMSPEQVRDPERLDARTDIYSLGVTLYEALTGEVPFRGLAH